MALSECAGTNRSFLLCLPGTYWEKQAIPDCRYDERCLHRRMESGSSFGFAVYEEWRGLNQCRSIIGMIWKWQHGISILQGILYTISGSYFISYDKTLRKSRILSKATEAFICSQLSRPLFSTDCLNPLSLNTLSTLLMTAVMSFSRISGSSRI